FLLFTCGLVSVKGYGISACCVFEQFSGVVSRLGVLILIAALVFLFVLKRIWTRRFAKTVSLILTSLAILLTGELTLLIIEYNYGYSLATEASAQLIGLVSIVLWLLAVRQSPDAPLQRSA
ncbi:MAG TPA: hypothetical protein VJA94_18900, partial [Candidatus Angelobacter sp.]